MSDAPLRHFVALISSWYNKNNKGKYLATISFSVDVHILYLLFCELFGIQEYKIQDTRYKIQNTKYKIQNTKYKIQDTKYKSVFSDSKGPPLPQEYLNIIITDTRRVN